MAYKPEEIVDISLTREYLAIKNDISNFSREGFFLIKK